MLWLYIAGLELLYVRVLGKCNNASLLQCEIWASFWAYKAREYHYPITVGMAPGWEESEDSVPQ